MRHLQFCLFQWLSDKKLYLKVLEMNNASDGTISANFLQQVSAILWPNGIVLQPERWETAANYCLFYDGLLMEAFCKKKEFSYPNNILIFLSTVSFVLLLWNDRTTNIICRLRYFCPRHLNIIHSVIFCAHVSAQIRLWLRNCNLFFFKCIL